MKQLLALLILFLAACTAAPNTSNPTNETSNLPTPTREGSVISDDTGGDNGSVIGDPGFGFGENELPNTPFAALVTGALEITVTGDGAFGCENGVYVIRSSASDFPQVSLILPANAEAATYELADNQGDGSVASASLFLQDGRVYAANVEGLLVVVNIASAPMGQISGSFDFTAHNGSDEVNVRGQFNMIAAPDAVFCN
jgi:hypothetical protein